jgi:hypothetical protein
MTERELHAIADRMMIRELIDEYSNLCSRKACERLHDLFIEDCVWRTRGANQREFIGREAVVSAIRGVVERYPLIMQMPHAPRIEINGNHATATTLMHEFGKLDATTTAFTFAIYRDTFVRTADTMRSGQRPA